MHYFLESHLNIVKFAPYIFLVSILIFLGIGWLFGKYRLRISDKVIVRDALATAIFGLSALVLGFTFSSANDHFDKRVSLNRAQADAISQVYVSSKYLNPADQVAVRNSLKVLLADRLSVYQEVKSFKSLNENLDKVKSQLNDLNELITVSIPRTSSSNKDLADRILRPQADHLFEIFKLGTLNARHHPPAILERFLFTLLSVGALLSGYAMAVKNEEDWFLTAIYLGLIGFALYVIFALEFPNQLLPYDAINADLLRTQKLLQ